FTFSIYQLFFDLLPIAYEAHIKQDWNTLDRIYQYAEWCWIQNRAPDIQNAVAVAFYEHLVDTAASNRDIPNYIKSWIFKDICTLFEQRMSDNEYQDLLNRYNRANGTHFT
ncbi:MAG: hypothetical protein U0175_13250, partial [Caldilineaceae bacterium]